MKNPLKLMVCIAIFFGLLSLFGCNSIEPSKPSDTLLIGQISLDAKDFQDYTYLMTRGDTSISGKKLSGITLFFRNKDSQKTYAVTTDKYGAFYVLNPQPGNYIIEKLIFKNDVSLGWETLTASTINLAISQKLEAGKVYNTGLLHWNAWVDTTKEQPAIQTLKAANNGLTTITQDGGHDQLKASFAEKLPKSLWLQKEWVNIEISPLSQPANVKFDYNQTKGIQL